jgi:hypothetical protein
VHEHHVVYEQHCPKGTKKDRRNLIPLCKRCHDRHHDRTCVLSTGLLPDRAIEFAREVLGPGPAQAYFERRYANAADDRRVAALWTQEVS